MAANQRLFHSCCEHVLCKPYYRLITGLVILGKWQGRGDSNSRPPDLESGALPTELHPFITIVGNVYAKWALMTRIFFLALASILVYTLKRKSARAAVSPTRSGAKASSRNEFFRVVFGFHLSYFSGEARLAVARYNFSKLSFKKSRFSLKHKIAVPLNSSYFVAVICCSAR
jgi:hypothetical protein